MPDPSQSAYERPAGVSRATPRNVTPHHGHVGRRTNKTGNRAARDHDRVCLAVEGSSRQTVKSHRNSDAVMDITAGSNIAKACYAETTRLNWQKVRPID